MSPLVIALAIVVAAPAAKTAPKKDPPSIVGEWIPESAIIGGKPDPPPAGSKFTFTKDGKAFMQEKDEKPDEMNYSIDAKSDPKGIDLKETRKAMGGVAGIAMRGIYKIEGDTLTICLAFGDNRPKTFTSPANSTIMLITFKRAKKD